MPTQALATCHCGRFSHVIELNSTSLYKGGMCHCSDCRIVTGNLYWAGFCFKPNETVLQGIRESLIAYATSSSTSRYFCGACGTHLFCHSSGVDLWCVSSGTIEHKLGNHGIDRFKHRWIKGTIDGGLVNCFPPGQVYLGDISGAVVSDWRNLLIRDATVQQHQSQLSASCHCGSVCFSIDRPDDREKWTGCLCACRSCRLSFGQPITTFLGKMPYSKITWSDGTSHDGSVHESTVGYRSSEHARRDFCKKCGACVFYNSTNQSGLLDVATGLLRAKEGALARSWIDWDISKVHFSDEADDHDFVQHVTEMLRYLNDSA